MEEQGECRRCASGLAAGESGPDHQPMRDEIQQGIVHVGQGRGSEHADADGGFYARDGDEIRSNAGAGEHVRIEAEHVLRRDTTASDNGGSV